jgi:hypothetical protein
MTKRNKTSQDLDNDDDEDMEVNQELPTRGVDVTQLAKAINKILDDGGMGLAVAEVHEIQVATPGSSDELEGIESCLLPTMDSMSMSNLWTPRRKT